MKLIDCYVSAFGNLSEYEVNFKDGLTSLTEDNGFGKTTIAAFIKAMFYGLPGARKGSSPESSERVRYCPWTGSIFGGRLTFSANGKKYRIIRSFGRQSITADDFQLVDAATGKPSTDYSEKIGEELFGVDEQGFMRSTFSDGNVSLSSLPLSVRSKIGNQVDNAEDLSEFGSAEDKIIRAIKLLKGKKGVIDELGTKISQIKSEIELCKTDGTEHEKIVIKISQLEEKKKQLLEERQNTERKIEQAAGAEAASIRLSNYNRLAAKIEALKEHLCEIEAAMGGKCPDDALVSEIGNLTDKEYENTIALCSEDKKAQSPEYLSLINQFENDSMSDDEAQSFSDIAREADLLNEKLATLENDLNDYKSELDACRIENVNKIPSDAELFEMRSIGNRVAVSTGFSADKKSSGPMIGFYIVSAACLAAAVATFTKSVAVGIALAAVGVVSFIAALLLSFVKKTVGDSSRASSCSQEERQRLSVFLSDFGFSQDADINLVVDKLKKASLLKSEADELNKKIAQQKKKISEAERTMLCAVKRFGSEAHGSVTRSMQELLKRRGNYLDYVLPLMERISFLRTQVEKTRSRLEELFASTGFQKTQNQSYREAFNALRSTVSGYRSGIRELDSLLAEAKESFERDKISQINTEEKTASVSELGEKKAEINRELDEISALLVSLRLAAQRLSESKGRLTELSEQLEGCDEQLENKKYRLSVLEKTHEFLCSAKDSLSSKYAGSVEKSFVKYSTLFFGKEKAAFRINSELELSVEKEGLAREPQFFSEGQQCVMDVCLRLSLIDAMFEKEKPPLILDDPFASLDEKNLACALGLVAHAAKERQIIYLTCHFSRVAEGE